MPSRRRATSLPRVGGGRPPRRLLVVLALALVLSGFTAYFSGATFVSSTDSRVTINAAEDLTPPTVDLRVPAVVSGVATVTVEAADARGTVTRVVVQRRTSGGTWSELCTRTTAPWGCTWDTTRETDGAIELRAIATDSALLTATSGVVQTRVANAGEVRIAPIGAVRGSTSLSATISNAAGRPTTSVFAVRFDGGTWTTVCTGRTGLAPSCTHDFGSTTRGADVRVTTTFGSGATASTATDQTRAQVDGTDPTVSLTLPGTLTGAVSVAPVVADAHSGLASVRIEYRRLGLFGHGWRDLCTTTNEPWSCVLDTSNLSGGFNYEVRATATDRVGLTAVDSATARVSVWAALAITSPADGDTVSGVLEPTVSANAGLLGSVSWVKVSYRRAGTNGWTEICTDTSAPYSCTWDTRHLANGGYELRADTPAALGTTSDVVTVAVDNPPARALDVQARNGGTPGVLDAGDTFTFTFSAPMTFSATTVTASVHSAQSGGAFPGSDWWSIPGVGDVAFDQTVRNPNGRAIQFPVRLTAQTATVDGVPGTVITATVQAFSTNFLRTGLGAGTLRWFPAATLRDTADRPLDTTAVTESGGLDVDF